MNKFKTSKISLITSRSLLILGVVLLVLFSVALAREIIRKVEINREMESLKDQITALEAKNVELADLIQYLNSTSWQEKEAREKLNLQKGGESVISILVPGDSSYSVQNGSTTAEAQLADIAKMSNPQKWFKYFFN